MTRAIVIAVVMHALASLAHFVHNAERLSEYPNMPAWISREGVYVNWLAMTLVAGAGLVLLRQGRTRAGLIVLGIYAVLGFGGLDHYTLAPASDHSLVMNLTIGLETLTAACLLAVIVATAWRSAAR